MGWWIATEFGPLANDVDALWVQAEDEQEAANKAAEHFDELARENSRDREPPEHIHLVEASGWKVYGIRPVADLIEGEFACCGGLPGDRHTGLCPNGRNGEPDE